MLQLLQNRMRDNKKINRKLYIRVKTYNWWWRKTFAIRLQ